MVALGLAIIIKLNISPECSVQALICGFQQGLLPKDR